MPSIASNVLEWVMMIEHGNNGWIMMIEIIYILQFIYYLFVAFLGVHCIWNHGCIDSLYSQYTTTAGLYRGLSHSDITQASWL